MTRFRELAERSRQRSVPPPPAGVLDLQWQQLYPPTWKPGQTLDRLGVDKLQDNDPRAPAVMAAISRAWQNAPLMPTLPQGPVRLMGFALMLDDATGATKTVVLAPYYASCVHSPTPPPNQMVLVTLNREIASSMFQYPIWVTGKLLAKPGMTPQGRVAYRIENAQWEAYPYLQLPMPQYHFPR